MRVPESLAYAKLQSLLDGEDYFVRRLPFVLASRKHPPLRSPHFDSAQLTDCLATQAQAVIYYDHQRAEFRALFCPDVFLNECAVPGQDLKPVLARLAAGEPVLLELQGILLQSMSNIYARDQCKMPQVFKFILPIRNFAKKEVLAVSPSVAVAKAPDRSQGQKWSPDDRQQLKKFLLLYGYGRWRQIMRSSTAVGGKLQQRGKPEVRAYGNSFIRALEECLGEEETDLKFFLLNLIEEKAEDPFVQSSVKEWDPLKILRARSVQYTKRLQLLFRVRTLIKRYQQGEFKTMGCTDKAKVNYENLLNFIPVASLFGQRPAVWWSKRHDIDLILGVYQHGYANYEVIKAAYNWQDSSNPFSIYEEFPSADSLTRRLKKLMLTINRIELNEGRIDFEDDAESEQEDRGWSNHERRVLFALVSQFGVPVMPDNKHDWNDLRDRLKERLKERFDKPPSVVQKQVERMRWTCQEILNSRRQEEDKDKDKERERRDEFVITYNDALKFNKNTNILSFLRKCTFSPMEFREDLVRAHAELTGPLLAPEMGPDDDLQLIDLLRRCGFQGMPDEWLRKKGFTADSLMERVQWLCNCLRMFRDRAGDKRKKQKESDDKVRMPKYDLVRDQLGNIVFPIQINQTLRLLALGRVIPHPNYHSEHNLFPVGFKTVRTHLSMFSKGRKCDYTCEILEGDGKPLYKVTCEEDPEHPIVKDSSTGCWVHIYSRVNNLQDVRKDKVTISGTERFGLHEIKVVRLLEDLPLADQCPKYLPKYKGAAPS